MIVGLLQFELLVHGAGSIKDKRSVVKSVKDRLHREHQVSVAEIGLQDRMGAARLGLAVVGSDGAHVGRVLDQITAKLRGLAGAELGDCAREILHDPRGPDGGDGPPARDGDRAIDGEMLSRGLESEGTGS